MHLLSYPYYLCGKSSIYNQTIESVALPSVIVALSAVLQTSNFSGNMRIFHYHGNRGRSGANLNDTVKLTDLENPQFGTRIWVVFAIQAALLTILCSNA